MGILNRLNNDVNKAILDSPYFVNQNRGINKFEESYKDGKIPLRDKRFNKRFLNGGVVVDNNTNYNGFFDLELSARGVDHTLVFESFEDESSINFEEFINNIHKSDNLIIDHLDLSKELKEVTKLIINNSEINYKFTSLINKYFHNLKNIEMNKCRVRSDADFSKINSNIKFSNSDIDNIRVFNNTSSNFEFWRTNINSISPCIINSSEIMMPSIGGKYKLDLKELFLKVNFPDLKTLDIRPDTLELYSFEDKLIFLPYSAPNIENLYVGGKVSTLSFLERLPYLLKCSIDSVYDDTPYSFFYPYVTDKKERNKLSIRNNESIKYLSQLKPFIPEKYLICEAEYQRIMNLKDTFYLIKEHYENEYEELINGKKHELNSSFIPDGYYSMMYYKIVYRKNNKEHIIFCDEPIYKIEKNIMYDDSRSYDKDRIIPVTKFIYHPSGIPILFDARSRIKPPSYEELLKRPKGKEYPEEDLKYDSFREVLDDDFNSLGEFFDALSVRETPTLSLSDYRVLSKKLYRYMSEYYRYKDSKDDIADKNDKAYESLLNVIKDNFDKFTIEEEALILTRINEDVYRYTYYPAIDDYYFHLLNYDYYLEESINEKTNGLYKKYKNLLKETKKQLRIDYYDTYDKTLTKEDIKTLKLNINKLYKKDGK